MAVEVTCNSCKRSFPLGKTDEKRYLANGAKNLPVALECPLCGRAWLAKFAVGPLEKAQPQLRCPVLHCAGWVDHIENQGPKPFWGCGGCGSRWFDLANLHKEISEMVVRYSYRKKCYKKAARGTWLPVPLAKQDGDYEDNVEREPRDKKRSFVRG